MSGIIGSREGVWEELRRMVMRLREVLLIGVTVSRTNVGLVEGGGVDGGCGSGVDEVSQS